MFQLPFILLASYLDKLKNKIIQLERSGIGENELSTVEISLDLVHKICKFRLLFFEFTL